MRILRYTLFLFAIGLISCEQEFDKKRLCQNSGTTFFYAQSPDFHKPGISHAKNVNVL